MKAALISDTHGMLPDPKKFEKVDFILHAGDIGPDWYKGKRGIFPWYKDEFSEWARAIGKPIHMTWGNHDFIGERADHSIWEELLPENVHIHVDEQVEIEGKKVWFSPWSPTFGNWAWMCLENDLATKYINIPARIFSTRNQKSSKFPKRVVHFFVTFLYSFFMLCLSQLRTQVIEFLSVA